MLHFLFFTEFLTHYGKHVIMIVAVNKMLKKQKKTYAIQSWRYNGTRVSMEKQSLHGLNFELDVGSMVRFGMLN